MIRALFNHLNAVAADERHRFAFWIGAYAGTIAALIGICVHP